MIALLIMDNKQQIMVHMALWKGKQTKHKISYANPNQYIFAGVRILSRQ